MSEIVKAKSSADAGGGSGIGVFPCFDGLRAIAAVTVLVSHVAVYVFAEYPDAADERVLSTVAALSRFGVFVFFMLSGFLLYRPFVLSQLTGGARPGSKDFWIRRGGRILPGYWFALVGAIALGAAGFTSPRLSDYFAAFALLQNYRANGIISSGLFVAWTLVIEVAFYAMLPAFAAVAWSLSRTSNRRVVMRSNVFVISALGLIGMGTRFVAIFVVGTSAEPSREWFPLSNLHSWLPSYMDVFALGMAVAVVCAWRETGGGIPRAVAAFTRRPWAAWSIAGLMVVALGRAGLPRIPGDLAIGPTALFISDEIAIIAALALLIPAALPGPQPGGIRRFLASRPVVLTGILAFGIYLWQLPIMEAVAPRHARGLSFDSPATFTVAVTLATLGIAYVSYVAVEVPGRDLALRLAGRLPAPRAGRWQWLRIDMSGHEGRIEGFIWDDEPRRRGEWLIITAVLVGTAVIVGALPALRQLVG